MIPVLIVFGLLAGRWWKTALIVGTLGWAAVLLVTGVIDASQLLGTALFGLANTGVGVAVHQGVARVLRRNRTNPAEQVATPVA